MMFKKLLLLLSSLIYVWMFAGCAERRAQMASSETNLLGVVKIEEESYGSTGPNTIPIHTDELFTRRNPSGEKVTILWGLITLKDY